MRGLNQQITYWAPGAENQFSGKVYGTPTVLIGRWEDKLENVIDSRGQEIVSKSRIFLEQEVASEGYIAQGDQSGTVDPRGLQGAYEIRAVGTSPNMGNLKRLYTVFI